MNESNGAVIMNMINELPDHLQEIAIQGSIKILSGQFSLEQAIEWTNTQIQAQKGRMK